MSSLEVCKTIQQLETNLKRRQIILQEGSSVANPKLAGKFCTGRDGEIDFFYNIKSGKLVGLGVSYRDSRIVFTKGYTVIASRGRSYVISINVSGVTVKNVKIDTIWKEKLGLLCKGNSATNKTNKTNETSNTSKK